MESTQNIFKSLNINSSLDYLYSSDVVLCLKGDNWELIKNRHGIPVNTPDVLIEILCNSIISMRAPVLFKEGFKQDLYETIDNVVNKHRI
jgi:hypothetical protein